jgi:hypothetical protein
VIADAYVPSGTGAGEGLICKVLTVRRPGGTVERRAPLTMGRLLTYCII